MTTRRRLKKEIDYAVSDLMIDCMTYANLYKKPDDEDTTKIIQETMTLRNQLRNMANHPEQKDNSESSKAFYNNIAKTLVEGISKGYGNLGKLVNKAE